jgi:hypothetical protein
MPPHCDALDGPVVAAAQRALETGDVGFVLPYVSKTYQGGQSDASRRRARPRVKGPFRAGA